MSEESETKTQKERMKDWPLSDLVYTQHHYASHAPHSMAASQLIAERQQQQHADTRALAEKSNSQSEQANHQAQEANDLSKKANDLSEKSNQQSEQANRLSAKSNQLAWVAVVVALVALLVAVLAWLAPRSP